METVLSYVLLFRISWTVARQAPLPMEFSRQEYWTERKKKKNTGLGCHFLLQGILTTQDSNSYLLRVLRGQADS